MVWVTRWLITAAGPGINLLAGANRYPPAAFLFFAALGEAVWAGGYLGLGWLFGDAWAELEDLVGNLSSLAAALAAALVLGALAWRMLPRPGRAPVDAPVDAPVAEAMAPATPGGAGVPDADTP